MKKGFTLIELLVVVGICALLTALTLGYTARERNVNVLSVESAKVAGFISSAKDLAISTYFASSTSPAPSPKVCGYGVSVDPANNEYSIFAYEPLPSRYPDLEKSSDGTLIFCPLPSSTLAEGIISSEEAEFTPGSWKVKLDAPAGFATGESDALSLVLFMPPEPATLISRDGSSFLDPASSEVTSKIYLQSPSSPSGSGGGVGSDVQTTAITVNGFGQINFGNINF